MLKLLLALLALLIVAAPMHTARAIDICALGTSCNPLQVNLVPDYATIGRMQEQNNSDKMSRLLSQYGWSAFSDCNRKKVGSDSSNPAVRAMELSAAEMCLSFFHRTQPAAPLQQVYTLPAQPTTPDYNAGCQKTYGSFAQWTGKFENQRYVCDCKSGSQWNEGKTACTLPLPTKLCPVNAHRTPNAPGCTCDQGYIAKDGGCVIDNNAICQRDFGAFAEWVGTVTDGRIDCGCQKGYEFGTNNQCVLHAGNPTAALLAARPKKIHIYDFSSGKRGKLLRTITFNSLRVQAVSVPSTNILIVWEGGTSHANIVEQGSLQLQGSPEIFGPGVNKSTSARALKKGKTYSFKLSQEYVVNSKAIGGASFDLLRVTPTVQKYP